MVAEAVNELHKHVLKKEASLLYLAWPMGELYLKYQSIP